MAKTNFEKMFFDRFDRLEQKIDRLATEIVPRIEKDAAVFRAEIRQEAKSDAKHYGRIWGGITLAVSLVGLAMAHLR